jgi:hypothetical protein
MQASSKDGPKIVAHQIYRTKGVGSRRWVFGWRIQNLTSQPIDFLAAWCPHGQFRSSEKTFDPPFHIAAGEDSTLELTVLCDGPAGAVVENGFLILTSSWLNNRWRIFVRLRIVFDKSGEPDAETELISTQRVGFSGVS